MTTAFTYVGSELDLFSAATYFSGTPYVENSGLSMSLARVGLNFKF